VDEEIRKVVITAYDHARTIVERNRNSVESLAQALLDRESLEADEIKALLATAGARA
jgi:cell division protease FtsH